MARKGKPRKQPREKAVTSAMAAYRRAAPDDSDIGPDRAYEAHLQARGPDGLRLCLFTKCPDTQEHERLRVAWLRAQVAMLRDIERGAKEARELIEQHLPKEAA